jgi:hypothetical protein
MADDKTEDRTSFWKRLDQAEDVAVTIGLVASGMVFAVGMAGLLFVINHVFTSKPPSFGSQGEWLYGAIACLLVAGWGFSQAASFYARKARAAKPQGSGPMAKMHLGRDGFSFEMNPTEKPDAGEAYTATWSSGFGVAPVKTIELTEAQISAAEAAAQPGVNWDAVCRQINPEYATWPGFEQNLYRRAMQTSVEKRRQPK